MTGLKVIDGTPTAISKYLREKESSADKIKEQLCCRCKKNKATITFCNSALDLSHGFTQRICQECYDKQMQNSEWYKQGYQFAKQELLNLNKSSHKIIWDIGYNKANQEFIEKLNELKGVHCVNMPEEFIFGSNWCNNLWENKIENIKKSLGGKNE